MAPAAAAAAAAAAVDAAAAAAKWKDTKIAPKGMTTGRAAPAGPATKTLMAWAVVDEAKAANAAKAKAEKEAAKAARGAAKPATAPQ